MKPALVSAGRFVVVLLVQLILTPRILHAVGTDDFGLWSLTFAVLGMLGLLDGGLATSAVKLVAECRGTGDHQRRNTLLGNLLWLYLLLSAGSVALLLVLSVGYTHWFHLPAHKAPTALALLWLLALRAVVLALPLSLFHSMLFGEGQTLAISAVQVGTNVLYGATVLLVLPHGGGIVPVAVISLGAMLLEYGLYALLAFRLVPELRLAPLRPEPTTLRELAGFSGTQLIANIAQLVRLRTDPILVQSCVGLGAVASYALALRIAESALLLVKQAVNVLGPRFAQHRDRRDECQRLLLVGSQRALLGATVLCVPLAYLAPELLRLWVGPGQESAIPPLRVLLVALALTVPQLVAALALVMTGHHVFSARAQSAGVVLNIVASLLLVPVFGALGVALGTLVATLVIDVVIVLPFACRVQGLSPLRYFVRVFGPALVAGGVLAALIGLVKAL